MTSEEGLCTEKQLHKC